MSDDMDPLAEIRASFFIECEELLESLQDGLQSMEDGENDSETINVVFRAVHSIKGGAGAFGLEPLVRFAHRYETALDEVRGGRLEVSPDAQKLFFAAADHLSDLVRVCRDNGEIPDERSSELLRELDALIGEDPEEEAEENIDFQPMGLSLDIGGVSLDDDPEDTVKGFNIHFRPHADLYETGNEPQQLLKSLSEIGEAQITLKLEDLPDLSTLQSEKSFVSWDIALTTNATEPEISSIFEFVEGLCTLELSPFGAPDEPMADTLPPLASSVTTEKDDTPAAAEPPVSALPDPAAKVESAPTPPAPAPASAPAPAAEQPGRMAPKPSLEPTSKASKPANAPKSVVRVDLDRIERLVNLVGELVINQAMLTQSIEQAGLSSHSDAMNGLEEFQRLTRDIQDSVMMIRAQPVKSLFQRMSRIVREASAAVKKDVRLITEGENTEVDKTVIERLADPLTHMIRNAVDHGLEDTEKRLASGKQGQGTVRLSAAHKSGRVVIDISDDGAGINRPAVLEKAIEKGLISPDANLTESEIDNLLFLPGFSTAKTLSDLSGRGVGMDVVRTAIQALGGKITITSEPGIGTTFSISLPLTLAVLDGMVVDTAGETLVVPLNQVIETLTLSDLDVDMIRPGVMAIRVRGSFVPVYDLGVILGYREPLDDPSQCIVLLIALEDGQRSALMIDQIRDQRQVVIKGLDDTFYRSPGIAAATILGDGQIALILDPADVISLADGAANTTQVIAGASA